MHDINVPCGIQPIVSEDEGWSAEEAMLTTSDRSLIHAKVASEVLTFFITT